MKATIKIELQDFEVPELVNEVIATGIDCFITRQYLLSELPTEILHELCDRFRREVFAKADRALELETFEVMNDKRSQVVVKPHMPSTEILSDD